MDLIYHNLWPHLCVAWFPLENPLSRNEEIDRIFFFFLLNLKTHAKGVQFHINFVIKDFLLAIQMCCEGDSVVLLQVRIVVENK